MIPTMTTTNPDPADVSPRPGRAWLVAGYVGTAGFLVLEAVIRKSGTASSLKSSGDDENTSRVLISSSVLAAALPVLARWGPVRALPAAAAPAGLFLQLGGLALRLSAMRTLGGFYTRTLQTVEAQPVVEAGPYRLVRHPGYAGAMLMWIGLGLASRNGTAAAAMTTVMAWAYRRRIVSEEKLLVRVLPEYESYRKRTNRIIPYLW